MPHNRGLAGFSVIAEVQPVRKSDYYGIGISVIGTSIMYLLGTTAGAVVSLVAGVAFIVVGRLRNEDQNSNQAEVESLFGGAVPRPVEPSHPSPTPAPFTPYTPIMTFPPPSAQEKLAELELKQKQLDLETKSYAQALCVWVDALKKKQGTSNLALSEDFMRQGMNEDSAFRMHAILELLRKEGRARKADSPGWWFID